MPWPIPALRPFPDPLPMRWRNWIVIFILTMTCGAALALYLWPRGKTGHQFDLGLLAIGAPGVAFLAMLGARLTHYGRAKLRHDVWEQASRRLASDWQRWSQRSLVVAKASVFLPPGLHASAWLEPKKKLPVNLDRCVSLGWAFANTAEQWVTHLFGLIVERFVQDISASKGTLNVHVLLDEATYSELRDSSFDGATLFVSLIKMAGVLADVTFVMRSATAVNHIGEWIDGALIEPLLLIAGQRSAAGDTAMYSEGACALFFSPKAVSAHSSSLQRDAADTRAFRPMVSNIKALKSDVEDLLLAQSMTDKPIDVWHTGLDGNAQGIVLNALSIAKGGMADSERDMQQNRLDEVLGIPGPVSNWIALSLAAHASPRRERSQLVVSASPGKSMVICMVSGFKADLT
jgi:hypothetical protein